MTATPQAPDASIVARIQKLLALASSSNEHEAALAAERAADLLQKHNLSMDELRTEDASSSIGHGTPYTKAGSPWIRYLWQSVAKLNFCGYAYSTANHRTYHYVIGTQANVTATTLMAEYLTAKVYDLCTSAAATALADPHDPLPPSEKGRFSTAFREGCGRRIALRLRRRYEDLIAAPTPSTSSTNPGNLPALYNSHESAVADYMAETLGTAPTKARRSAVSHAQGLAQGRAAGDQVGLDTQIASSTNPNPNQRRLA